FFLSGFERRSQTAATASSFASVHHDLYAPVRALFFDRAVWRGAEFRRSITARLDLRGADSHCFHQISLHAVGAALAEVEIVFRGAKRIRVAFYREFRFLITLNKGAKLLQLANGANL